MCHSPPFLETETGRRKKKEAIIADKWERHDERESPKQGKQRGSEPEKERTKRGGNVRRERGRDQVKRDERKTSCIWETSGSWRDVEVGTENDKELSQMDSAPPPVHPLLCPLHSPSFFSSLVRLPFRPRTV